MTDNEIIKALECCCTLNGVGCQNCPQYDIHSAMCVKNLIRNALDLINRQKAQIKRLQHYCFGIQNEPEAYKDTFNTAIDETKSEAIKEFAERLKNEICCEDDCGYNCFECCYECKDYVPVIDNLVKEMTEIETNQRKEDEGK